MRAQLGFLYYKFANKCVTSDNGKVTVSTLKKKIPVGTLDFSVILICIYIYIQV